MKAFFSGHKKWILRIAAASCIIAVTVSWTMARTEETGPQSPRGANLDTRTSTAAQTMKWSKAVLEVSNMSCGGCIDTIKKSVASLQGTGEVTVDLASATAEVLFDAGTIAAPESIAQAITKGGYPAKIRRIVSARQFRKEMDQASELARTYIARVGRLNIPRKDFEIELGHVRSRYEQLYGPDTFTTAKGSELLSRIESQTARRLVEEAIKYQEVERAGHAVSQNEIDSALSNYVKTRHLSIEQFMADLDANGYPFDYFMRKFAQRIQLQSYLEENILTGSTDPDDRRQRFNNWLANARTAAEIEYYDKAIESSIKSSTGGSCGGGSGGGCSVSQ